MQSLTRRMAELNTDQRCKKEELDEKCGELQRLEDLHTSIQAEIDRNIE